MSLHDASQSTHDSRIRRVEIATGWTSTLAGSGTQGSLDGAANSARFYGPIDIAIDPTGTFALVVVRRSPRIPPHPAIPKTAHTRLAHGLGAAPVSATHTTQLNFRSSSSLSVFLPYDASQDHYTHRIRRVEIATGWTSTLAGSGTLGFLDGAGGSAQFTNPANVAIEPSGGYALVTVQASLALAASLDSCNPPFLGLLQPAIPQTATRYTVLSEMVPAPHSTQSFGSSSFNVSSHASQDHWGHRIRRVDLATGVTSTLAGSSTPGFLDGAGGSARFKHPAGVAIDPTGAFALVAVHSSPAPPAHRTIPRIISSHTLSVGRTQSHRHATPRIGLALFAQPPPPSPCITGHV